MKAQGKIPALLLAAMSAGLAGAFGAEELRRVTGREGEVAVVTVPESAMILHVTQLFPEASGACKRANHIPGQQSEIGARERRLGFAAPRSRASLRQVTGGDRRIASGDPRCDARP